MENGTAATREFTGRHMLMVILGFFGVVIAANLALAFFAAGSWTGLIVPNSYVASQEYNHVLEQAAHQDALGWTSYAAFRDGQVRLEIADRNGAPVPALSVTGVIGRPTHEDEDRTLGFTRVSGPVFAAKAPLDPGVWVLDVTAEGPPSVTYRQTFRLWVPEDD